MIRTSNSLVIPVPINYKHIDFHVVMGEGLMGRLNMYVLPDGTPHTFDPG